MTQKIVQKIITFISTWGKTIKGIMRFQPSNQPEKKKGKYSETVTFLHSQWHFLIYIRFCKDICQYFSNIKKVHIIFVIPPLGIYCMNLIQN